MKKSSSGFAPVAILSLFLVVGLLAVGVIAATNKNGLNLFSRAGGFANFSPNEKILRRFGLKAKLENSATAGQAKLTASWRIGSQYKGASFVYRLIKLPSQSEVIPPTTTTATQVIKDNLTLTNGTYFFTVRLTQLNGEATGGVDSVTLAWPPSSPNARECPGTSPGTSSVGFWRMDEIAGGTVWDSSRRGNRGQATGTTIVDGRIRKARSFNGTGDVVTVPSSSVFDLINTFTIEAWVKSPNLSGHGNADIVTRAGWWTLAIGNAPGQIRLYDTSGHGAYINYSFTNDVWHHLAAVKNGSVIKIYVNGVEEPAVADGIWRTDSGGANNVTIGGGNNGHFLGAIDEVHIFNAVRGAAAIRADACQ